MEIPFLYDPGSCAPLNNYTMHRVIFHPEILKYPHLSTRSERNSVAKVLGDQINTTNEIAINYNAVSN